MKRITLLALACLVMGADPLTGMDWGISAGGGVCLLRQEEVQDIYGAGFPFGVRAWAGWGNWKIAVGYEYLSESGKAAALNGGSEDFPLKLKASSIPVALYYQVEMKDVFLALGGGASYCRYEESWEDVDIVTDGTKWGPLLSFLAGYRLSPKWSVFADIRFEPMPTGKSSLLVPEVKLGGLKIGAGVMFYL